MLDPDIWKDVHGFEGRYQVSYSGKVRRLHKNRPPRNLVPYQKSSEQGRKIARSRLMVGLIDRNGKKHTRWVHQLVAEHFLPPPEGDDVLYHKNGVVTDNWASNLGYTDRQCLGQQTGHISRSQPVVRIDQSGVLVEAWRSARAAAKDCFMSYQTIIDRCNGYYLRNGKRHAFKSIFAPDGYAYTWDDDRNIRGALKRIASEMKKENIIVNVEGYDREDEGQPDGRSSIWNDAEEY